ncbi:TonB-dependent receptor [Parabacteroides sp. Marseille-P3160]|uniref:SusC/RagA family TonB-linked outer membrane protein n=1 Tax=Parabacteroides sp. Marseille-P3160 TaxID=1917887 RepID=UPI002101370A|nr:TonB-dependent receptor [Parabacteroides sp. Marseille-P3160]
MSSDNASKKGAQQEGLRITGNVTDLKGEPLIGVNVMVKGTQAGVMTDINGAYSISVPNKYAILSFSYIGFVPKEEKVDSRRIVNIILEEDVGQLEEVVVVGYGTQKKASVVGSISTVEPGRLDVGTTRSLSNNLVGNVGGIIGAQRSGEPGYDNSDFWIRGINTFGGNRSPLVLVDGIERSLNDLDVVEIASFSVLKDAAASAVYGVRGANGVIIITTKRGKAGKTNISVKTEHSITEPVKMPSFLGSADYLQLLYDVAKQDNVSPLYEQDIIDKYRTGYDTELYPDVDWVKAISNDQAQNTRVSLDINGGTEKLRYSFVGAYYNEEGIIKRDEEQSWNSSLRVNRFNMRSNVDMNLTPTTLINFSIGGYLQKRISPPQSIDDLFSAAFSTPPFVHPIVYQNGKIPRRSGRDNPWARTTQTGYERRASSKLESTFSVEQDLKVILSGLKAKAIFSYDYYSANGVTRSKEPIYYTPATSRDPETGELLLSDGTIGQEFLGHSLSSEWGNNSIYLEGNLTYDKTFGEHAINALFLYNQRDYDDGDKLPHRRQGFAGRAAYTYGGRYIGEFNFGYNGSENFSKGKRFGFFPSIAVGWIMSEEAFWENYRKAFNKVKFRMSYGLAGNDQLDGRRFAYVTTIGDTGGYDWGTNGSFFYRAGRREGEIGISDLTWETVAKTNLGLELGLFNIAELQIDFFQEKRKDIFMQRNNFPNSAGFATMPWANFGKVTNRGFEVTLDLNKQVNKDFFIGARGTLTYAKNKVTENDEAIGIKGTHRSSIGKPVGQIFGLVAEGLFTEDDFEDVEKGVLKPDIPMHKFTNRVYPGDIKYKDFDEDGEITEKDRTAIGGTTNPELVYGFGVSTRYKNVDFGFLFQGNGRTYRVIGRGADFIPGANSGTTGNIYSNAYDSWTVDNPRQDAFYPRLHYGYNANNAQESTWWLKDMSMLRLKNLEIGYALPKSITRPAAISYARVFLRGTNLFCLSDFKLWDPEIDTPSNNGLRYPIMRSYSIGLEVNF